MSIRIVRILAMLALLKGTGRAQIINTVAGSPTCCNSADGQLATKTWLTSAAGMTIDSQGNLYINSGAKIRKVGARITQQSRATDLGIRRRRPRHWRSPTS